MILKTAGFMWHRNYVDWRSGKLIGYPGNSNRNPRDFTYQSAIYGLYDSSKTCVYIGQAGRGKTSGLFDRLRVHALEDHLFCFWERFTWFGLFSAEQLERGDYNTHVKTLSVADALNNLESMAIYLALPRFNLHLSSGFGHVEWYCQPEEYKADLQRYEAEVQKNIGRRGSSTPPAKPAVR